MPRIFGRLNAPQRVLFLAWLTALSLRAWEDVAVHHQWPCPGTFLKISALFLILGLFSEVGDDEAQLAGWLGGGFLVAYMLQAGASAQSSGHWFGLPVGQTGGSSGHGVSLAY